MWLLLTAPIIRDIMAHLMVLMGSTEVDTSPSMATDTEGAGTALIGTTATSVGIAGIEATAGTEAPTVEAATVTGFTEINLRRSIHDQFTQTRMKAHPLAPTINITDAPVFDESYGDDTSYPVIKELGDSSLHRVTPDLPPFDIALLVKRLGPKIVRSKSTLNENGVPEYKFVLFRTRGGCFVQWGEKLTHVFASNRMHALRVARRISQITRSLSPLADIPGFHMLKLDGMEIGSQFIPLADAHAAGVEEFGLYYGEEHPEWHEEFHRRFSEAKGSISLFSGPPGCGKSSYIRTLINMTAATHRWYFIPPHDISILSDAAFVGFWSSERKKHAGRKLVLLLEDAEVALMARETDNRNHVSTLLNLSDGILNSWLQISIICTINTTADLDSALLRPGRLLAHKVFPRLCPEQALRLARHKRIETLRVGQRDYSLAEILNPPVMISEQQQRLVGFAA